MKIQESAENYLEAILLLKKENGSVRSIDLAHHFNYSKPSISRAVSLLKSEGCILVDTGGFIELTDAGRKIAETIQERHEFITAWLVSIGVSYEVAAEDACRIEHVISEETFSKIKENVAP